MQGGSTPCPVIGRHLFGACRLAGLQPGRSHLLLLTGGQKIRGEHLRSFVRRSDFRGNRRSSCSVPGSSSSDSEHE
jgi:hypothetical protein